MSPDLTVEVSMRMHELGVPCEAIPDSTLDAFFRGNVCIIVVDKGEGKIDVAIAQAKNPVV